MEALLEAFQWIANFFGDSATGITYLLQQFYSWAIQKFTVFWIGMQIEMMQFAWGVARDILNDMGVSQKIMQSLGMLPSQVQSALAFFRMPECLMNVLTAYTTRFVMRFVPGG